MGTAAPHSLVDVVLDGQQVVAHRLEGQLVQHGGSGVEAAVQDEELGASLVWTLQSREEPSARGRGLLQPRRVGRSQGHLGVRDCHVAELEQDFQSKASPERLPPRLPTPSLLTSPMVGSSAL